MTLKEFARKKAEESAGIFIPNRIDAIEPFAHRLESIIKEWIEHVMEEQNHPRI